MEHRILSDNFSGVRDVLEKNNDGFKIRKISI